MNWLQALAASPVIERAGWTLLHSSWQGLAIAIGLAFSLPGIRKRGARPAYVACLGALLLLIVAPAITFFVVPIQAAPVAPARAATAITPVPVAAEPTRTPLPADSGQPTMRSMFVVERANFPNDGLRHVDLAAPAAVRPVATAPGKIASPPPAPTPTISRQIASWWREIPEIVSAWAPWFVAFWIWGVLALSLWNLGGWFAVHRLTSRDARPVSAAIHEAAARLSHQLGVTHAVRLLQSAIVESPVVIGALKPVILLPASLITELPADQLESLLAHELAHVLRHDYLVNLLQTAIETLLFYHPAVWWISAKAREERENCCDDLTVAVIRNREVYVKALAAVAGARVSTLAPAATGRIVLPRLRRILGLVDFPAAHPARWLTGAAILSTGLVLVGFHFIGSRSATAQKSVVSPSTVVKARTADRDVPKKRTQQFSQLGSAKFRSRDEISDLAFSPDGKRIAASSLNGDNPRVSLFDAKTGREVKHIMAKGKPNGWIRCVTFSPDGSKLLWGEIGGLVGIWDLAADRLVFREAVHQGMVNEVVFSKSGRLFATAGQDGQIQIRRLGDPDTKLSTLKVEENHVARGGTATIGQPGARCLAFTPDEKSLIAGGSDTGDLSIYSLENGQLLRTIRATSAPARSGGANPKVNRVVVTADGRLVMSAGQHTVPTAQTNFKSGHISVPLTEIRFWNLETGALVNDLEGDEDCGFGYADLSPDGKRVAVSDSGVLRILDAQSGKSLASFAMPGVWGAQPRFSPDGKSVALALGSTIGLFDVQGEKRSDHKDRLADGLISASWSRAGDRIVTGHSNGIVRVWEARSGRVVWEKLLAPVISPTGWNAAPKFVGFTADGRRVVVGGRRDDPVNFETGIVAVYDAADGRLLRQVIKKAGIWWGCLSPDGKLAVVATSNGSADDAHLYTIELETGRTLAVTPPESERGGFWQLSALQFLPDASTYQFATGSGEVYRYEAATARRLDRIYTDYRPALDPSAKRPRRLYIGDGAFSADGRTFVFSQENALYVWDVESGRMRSKIPHPHQHYCRLCLSADGKTVAASDTQFVGDMGSDTIRLFDVESGKPVGTIDPDDNRANILQFSPDGTKLFTGYFSGTATVWELADATAKSTPADRTTNVKAIKPDSSRTLAQHVPVTKAGGANRPQATDHPEFPTKGQMRIHVLDEAGRPVPLSGVVVSVWTDDKSFKPRTRRYTCDEQGKVGVDLPKSLWIMRLWAKKKGYCEEFRNFETNSRVHELLIPDDFTFHMVKGITLTGSVKNAEGQPVQGAEVECSYDRSGLAEPSPSSTDAQGRWKFENIRTGEPIQVMVTHPDYVSHDLRGFARNLKKFTTAPQSEPLPAFVLERGTRPIVKVTGPSGKPIKGAMVFHDDFLFAEKSVRTDENGLCRLASLPSGRMPITVAAKGWMPESRKVEIASNMPPLNFQLRAGKKLRLRFVDPSGAPVPKVYAVLAHWRGLQYLGSLGIPNTADGNGVLEWNWAPDDPVTLEVMHPGFARTEQTLTADDQEHVVRMNPVFGITGTVRDATTGREIDGFLAVPLLYFRPDDPFLARNKAQKQKSGSLAMQFDRSDVGHGIQVEAPGYRTFRTNKPYHSGDSDLKLDIRLQPSEWFTGRILDSEGRPVRGAKVGVASPLEQLDPEGLAKVESDSAIGFRVVSDDDGRFEIPSYIDRYALVVVSPHGFAEVEREANQIPGEIRLSRWAKLTGRLVQSGKPVRNCEIFLTPIRVGGQSGPHNFVHWTTTTGDDGSFAFEHVPPVPCSVKAWLHWGRPSPLKSSRWMPVLLAPGETREITLGGPGIDVTGQLVAENQPPGFDYHFALNYLVAKRPGIDPPATVAGKGFDWRKGWSDAWFDSEEGGAYRNTLHTWFVKPEPDGRFHISGVEPGEYDFAVNLYGSTEGCLVHPIAQRVVHFTVKPGETKLDLGKLSIPSFTLPKVGDVASDFSFETPSGAKTSLAALRGNYVLIDFWATWCNPCIEKLDQLEHLRKQFKGAKPLVVVGANLDAEIDRARDFLKQKPLPWQHALLGDWSATEVPRRFAVSTVPAYVLISPDGRILALEYSLEAITTKLEQETHSAKAQNSGARNEAPKTTQAKWPQSKAMPPIMALASAEPSKGTAAKAQVSKTGTSQTAKAVKRRKLVGEAEFPTRGSMRVQILDTAGKPIEKAKIHASIWTSEENFKANRDYFTDPKGFATIQLPKTLQILRLWADKNGYCGKSKNFQTDTAVHALVIPDDFEFRLIKGTLIGGVVKNEAGQPIKGAKVAYCYNGVFFNDDTTTDANGRWKFDDVEPDKEVFIRVTHPDYVSDRFAEMQKAQKVTTALLRAQTATIVMRRGFRIVGRVTDPAGRPVKRAILLTGDDPYFGSVTQPIVSDEQGQFQFPTMAARSIRVTVVAKSWMPETRQIQIAPGMQATDFQLKPGKKLRIRFVDRDGKPIPDVEVQVERWNRVQHLMTEPNWRVHLDIPREANKEGVFEWDWAPEDAVHYNFSAPGYAWAREVPVTADGSEHVQVLNSILRISGTVRDAKSGRTIDDFLAIPVIHFRPGFASLDRRNARKETAGQFGLEFDRTDAEHGVQIEAPGYKTFRTSHRWRSGDRDAVLDIRLEPGPRYFGSVVDEGGRPVKDARVFRASASEQFSINDLMDRGFVDMNSRVQTDGQGGFEIGAPLEKYTLIAMSRDGYGEVTLAASEVPGHIRLARWAKVTGRLVQSGKPVPNCHMMLDTIRLGGDDEPHVFINLQTQTDQDGSFAFQRVPPGPCHLRGWLHFSAASPLTSSESVPLQLAPGQAVDVALGGSGIEVTGQLVAQNQPPGFDYHFAINDLLARRPGIEPPAFLGGKGFDWRKGWTDAYRNSPEGRAYLETLHTWFVKPEPDGRIRITGVPPGDYDFSVHLYGTTEGCLVHPIAERVVHFSVKPGDAKLDLGKLSIPSFTLPKIGDVASDFSFDTPAGGKTSLAALRGNYVLVDFWATWCAPCVAKLDQVEQLREKFKGDKPLLVVGANLDARTDQAREFLKKKPLPWQHAFLGDWSSTDLPRRFAISSVPAYVLIGPDGRILAHEVSLDAIEAKLEQLTTAHHDTPH